MQPIFRSQGLSREKTMKKQGASRALVSVLLLLTMETICSPGKLVFTRLRPTYVSKFKSLTCGDPQSVRGIFLIDPDIFIECFEIPCNSTLLGDYRITICTSNFEMKYSHII